MLIFNVDSGAIGEQDTCALGGLVHPAKV
jgi:hypothetical protein